MPVDEASVEASRSGTKNPCHADGDPLRDLNIISWQSNAHPKSLCHPLISCLSPQTNLSRSTTGCCIVLHASPVTFTNFHTFTLLHDCRSSIRSHQFIVPTPQATLTLICWDTKSARVTSQSRFAKPVSLTVQIHQSHARTLAKCEAGEQYCTEITTKKCPWTYGHDQKKRWEKTRLLI